jgi:hypothetical protein
MFYYTGNTSPTYYIFSSITSNSWCLSTVLDGSCLLFGKSPCVSSCPDLCDSFFTAGSCPSPTPSQTSVCNIDFNAVETYNKHLYDLLAELIIKNDKKNIFIFTFNQLNNIPVIFTTTYHIHHHYHMDTNISILMNFIKDNLNQWSEDELDLNKLNEIKNKIIRINHKITPGYIIPYLLFNEDFEKSLARFFRVIRN